MLINGKLSLCCMYTSKFTQKIAYIQNRLVVRHDLFFKNTQICSACITIRQIMISIKIIVTYSNARIEDYICFTNSMLFLY